MIPKRVPLQQQLDVMWTENAALRTQNADLLEALLDVVNQSCQEHYSEGKAVVDAAGITAYEDALKLLIKLGYAKRLDNYRWELSWPERKGK